MAILGRVQIDAADDLDKELVSVPEWGGEVYVRALTVGERLKLEDGPAGESAAGVVVRLVAFALCGPDGASLFGGDAGGVEALSRKGAAALLRVKGVALRLNAIDREDVDALEKKS